MVLSTWLGMMIQQLLYKVCWIHATK